MQELYTIEYAYAYGVTLQKARRLTEVEKTHYTADYQDLMLIATGEDINLPHLHREDMPRCEMDGCFPGCGNMAWIITPVEWDVYLALERERAGQEAGSQRAEEIAELERCKADAERQADMPSAAEACAREKAYNDLHNEGGEGYVPHIYSRTEYETICARLWALKEGEDND